MAQLDDQRRAQDAWDRIAALGGHGVWDAEVVIVSLAKTGVTDDDLSLLRDFPYIQTLDLSQTEVGNAGLAHLNGLSALEALIVIDTKISKTALDAFRSKHPTVKVTSEPQPRAVNPFTGKPH